MNYSRRLWNDVMQCRRQPLDIVALMLVSCFLALLPATFYIASYINSSDVTNNLLQRQYHLSQLLPCMHHVNQQQVVRTSCTIFTLKPSFNGRR